MNIKELKNRGLQLRAIHDLLPKLARREAVEVTAPGEAGLKYSCLELESLPEKEEKENRGSDL